MENNIFTPHWFQVSSFGDIGRSPNSSLIGGAKVSVVWKKMTLLFVIPQSCFASLTLKEIQFKFVSL